MGFQTISKKILFHRSHLYYYVHIFMLSVFFNNQQFLCPLCCSADVENVFAAVIVLEEFCKELAAIVFVKYHGAI